MENIKSHNLLNRINTLHKVFLEDGQEMSQIEKDLLLEYVRKFYELLLLEDTRKDYSNGGPQKQQAISPQDQIKEQTLIAEVHSEPEHSAITDPLEESIPVEVESANEETASNAEDEKMHQLFEVQQSRDLSDRLSMIPIKDLSKALGINEKIINIKELFGGDNRFYEQVISDLNQLENFEEASQYLIGHVAEKYEWASEDKADRATGFIKIVRRRYL